MAEFLQAYGIWIFLGLMLLVMFRGHGMGCCGSGRHQPVKDEKTAAGEDKTGGQRSSGCH